MQTSLLGCMVALYVAIVVLYAVLRIGKARRDAAESRARAVRVAEQVV